MNRVRKYCLTAALASLLLSACGGGGGGSSNPASAQESANAAAPGGSDTSQSDGSAAETGASITESTGIITGFGSVFVNGVEYETDGTSVVTDDKDDATEGDLQVGMVVKVSGSINDDGVTGDARLIVYEEEVQGFVESIDLDGESFTVLGQTIVFDDLTNFEGITFDTLAEGQWVEVSGMVDANGVILATLVKLEDSGPESSEEQKVEGTVQNLIEEENRFELNDLMVDYSTAKFEHGTVDDLAEGVEVRVKSSRDLQEGVFLADTVAFQHDDDDDDDDESEDEDPVEIDGIIDSFESPGNFTVSGYPAMVDDDTRFLKGATIDDLVLNQRIKIKGNSNADDVILIEHLSLQVRNFLGLEGLVEAVDLNEQTLTMLGYTFQVDTHTHFIDSGPDRVKRFGLSDLLVDDRVEIKAQATEGEAVFLATKIKRQHEDEREGEDSESDEDGESDSDHDEDEIKLSGPVSAIDVDLLQFNLNGFLIQVEDTTEIDIHHMDDENLDILFELLEEGSSVKIEGMLEDQTVIAREVKLKNPASGKSGHTDEDDDEPGDDSEDSSDDSDDDADSGDDST